MAKYLAPYNPLNPARFNPANTPARKHVVADIRMREATGEVWVLCICESGFRAGTADRLAAKYARHIADMKAA
jgi:hypothetical protein